MSDELTFNGGPATTPGPATDAGGDESAQRRQAILALLRGRLHWAILLSLLLGGGIGYLAYKSVVPLYQVTGGVIVDRQELLFDVDDVTGMGRWASFLKQQEQLLVSSNVAERAMASPAWQARGEDAVQYDAAKFSSAVSAEFDKRDSNNNFFAISFEAPDAITAKAGNTALLQAYKDEFAYQTENEYHGRIAKLREVIQNSRNQINRHLGNRRTIMTDAEYDQMEGQLRGLQNQRLELRFQLDEVRAILSSRNPRKPEGTPTTEADLIGADPTLAQWQGEKEATEDAISELEFQGMGPDHPMVKRLYSRRDVVVNRMEQRIQQLMSDQDAPLINDPEYDNYRRLEQRWHRQLVDVEAELDQLSKKRSEVLALMQMIDSEREYIDDAQSQIDAINIEMESIKEMVDIRGSGPQPSLPYNAGKAKQMAALGGMLGLFLGFGLVMTVGLMDRRLRHAGDMKMGLRDTRMLGILPTLPENFADPEASERAAHAVHHIRTLLQISNRGTARVFSVTSPAAGSGKSSLTVAMGLSFAASESKTLVIDCDLVGAGLTRRVGAVVNRSVESILREDTVLSDDQINTAIAHAREKGTNLKDALIELGMLTKKDLQRLNRRQADSALGVLDACQGRSFSECVANTGIDNFSILPIGAAKPQDAGLLSPKALRSLIARAREEYDVVLIDTGPCLGSLEASMAAAEADATVLIVSRGDSKAMATHARDHLVSVGANVVGVVFNHALETDLNSSSFASIVSQERRTDPSQSLLNADPAVAARFGPLGSAVAAFGTPSKSPNGRPRKPTATAAANGNGFGH
jgi:Mrp family chromosome partitioning ATPase/uncharacterized protein involved in exopolysaccharide biosynthesis